MRLFRAGTLTGRSHRRFSERPPLSPDPLARLGKQSLLADNGLRTGPPAWTQSGTMTLLGVTVIQVVLAEA